MRHRRRRLHDRLLRARRQGPHDRLARDGAGRDEDRRVRRAQELRGPARQRHERRRPRHRCAPGRRRCSEYGTWPLRRALQPGIAAAQHGFTVDPTFFQQTDEAKAIFADFPATAALYLDPDGSPRDVGTRHQEPRPRAHLRAASPARAPTPCTRAPLAQAIVDTVKHPPLRPGSTRQVRPGVMELSDLAAYKAIDRDPTHIGYRGLDVYGMAPPSSRRLDGRRDPQHPRGLSGPGDDAARAARCTTTSRPRGWPTPTAARTSRTPAT